MGTGWRRAFCTSIPRDPETPVSPEKHLRRTLRHQLSPSSTPSPVNCVNFSTVFSAGNPSSSLHLRCRTSDPPLLSSPSSTAAVKSSPASPRSPSRFALLKATLRLSRSRCGICSQSVRSCQKTPVFTAECSHSFHFSCISDHVRSSQIPGNNFTCPVCSASWREVPLLSSVHSSPPPPPPAETAAPFLDNRKQESSCSKIYDDDEPLQVSSTCGNLHCNPIPEGEDEENGYVRIDKQEDCDYGVEIGVMPESSPMVSGDRNHQNYVVLMRAKAPDLPPQRSVSSVLDPSRRAPIDLVTVLDVSGSMTAAKLQMLKRAMRLLISSLGSSDRLSVVAFSVESKRLLPLIRMSRQGQRNARQIVDRLIVSGAGEVVSGDCRCIGHALRKATKVLEDRRQRNPVATIMLLSDSPRDEGAETEPAGHYRTPIVTSSSTEAVATRFAHLEIPIGNSSDFAGGEINSPMVEDVFSKCVSGLVSVVLQDVHIQLTFPSGSICSIYSAAATEGAVSPALSQVDGISVSMNLGDFYAAEKREFLVELRLPSGVSQQRHCLSLSYKCCYQNPTTRRRVLCRERSLVLPTFRQTSPTGSSLELRNLFITTRALVESRRLAELNDLDTAAHLLTTARLLLLQSKPCNTKLISSIESRLSEFHRRQRRRRQQPPSISTSSTPRADQLTPTSAWRAAEQLAKVAILRKSLSRVGDLHGFENARF